MDAGRELDAEVAKARGKTILGWWYADQDYDADDWEIYDERFTTRTEEELKKYEKHPIFLKSCRCDVIAPLPHASRYGKLFGHYLSCLGVAPHYSADIAVAWAALMRPVFEAGNAAWLEIDGHTGFRAGMTSDAGRFEEQGESEAHAICLAFLACNAAAS